MTLFVMGMAKSLDRLEEDQDIYFAESALEAWLEWSEEQFDLQLDKQSSRKYNSCQSWCTLLPIRTHY